MKTNLLLYLFSLAILLLRDTSKGCVNQILASNSQKRNYEVMAHLLCSKSFVGTVVLDQVLRHAHVGVLFCYNYEHRVQS